MEALAGLRALARLRTLDSAFKAECLPSSHVSFNTMNLAELSRQVRGFKKPFLEFQALGLIA